MKKKRFSERMGITAPKAIQFNDIDNDLRTDLWNAFYSALFDNNVRFIDESYRKGLYSDLWSKFLMRQLDLISAISMKRYFDEIKNFFFEGEWYRIYDLIEFIYDQFPVMNETEKRQSMIFIIEAIKSLEDNSSGYTLINGVVTPITNESEISEIETAITESDKNNMDGVNEHLKTALKLMSDKKNPDCRNSIKESISAIESICRIIVEKENATLGDALNTIEKTKKVELHPALKKGYESIYGYTSDANGIRHAINDKDACDFADAKYMLVSCSAFVNYLIMKSQKAGINFNA